MILVVVFVAASAAVGGTAFFLGAVMLTLPRESYARPVVPRAALVAPRQAVQAPVIDVPSRSAYRPQRERSGDGVGMRHV
jgi:hypothetical protein